MPAPASKRTSRAGRTRFGDLFRRNRPRFLRFARHLKKVDPEAPDPSDALQQASAEYLERTREVKSDTHFVQLFRRFVLNVFRNDRKRREAVKRGEGRRPVTLVTEGLVVSTLGPGTCLARDEEKRLLESALEALKPEERHIVYLRLWESSSWSEVAAGTGLPSEDAARMRYARVLRKLKCHLAALAADATS